MNIEDKANEEQSQALFTQNIPNIDEIKDFFSNLTNLTHHEKIINKVLKLAKELSQVEALL
jgi:hypothetical protein